MILVVAQGSSILEMRCLAAVGERERERERQEMVNSVISDQESQNIYFMHTAYGLIVVNI